MKSFYLPERIVFTKYYNSNIIYNNNVSIQVCTSLKHKKAARFLLSPMVFYFAGAKTFEPLTVASLYKKVAGAAISQVILHLFRKKSFRLSRKVSLFLKTLKTEIFSHFSKIRSSIFVFCNPFFYNRIFYILILLRGYYHGFA